MNEKEMINILKNKKRLLEVIAQKRLYLYEDIQLIERQMQLNQTELSNKELENLLVERITQLKRQLPYINQEEYHITKVWCIFSTLETRCFEVLNLLYVLKFTWERVEADLKLDHKSVVKIRKDAIEYMLSAFHSEQMPTY